MTWAIGMLGILAAAAGEKVSRQNGSAAPTEWVILPPAEAEHFIHPCSRHVPDGLSGAWMPTAADVAPVDAALPSALAAAIVKLPPHLRKDPPAYYRQYGGVLFAGKRVIYVVGLSKAMIDRRPRPFRGWRKKHLRLCDAGVRAFGAIFDPITRTFVSFEFDMTF